MDKPPSYKWFQRICWFQIIISIFLILVAIATVKFKAESGFWLGFQEKLVSMTDATSLNTYEAAHAGQFLAYNLFAIIPTGLGLSYAAKGKRTATIVSFIVELMFTLGIVPIICLIIAFFPSFKRYLHHLKTGVNQI